MSELSRRDFLLLLLTALASAAPGASAWAKGGGSGSGSGSGSSGSGSGSNSGSGDDGGDGGDDDGDNDDDDDNSGKGRRKDQDDILDAVRKGKVISLEKAMKSLQSRYSGRVIDAKLRGNGGDLVYSFKLKSVDGKVRRVEMDARTGKLLNFLGF